jgi:P4 family phage/plasmid primase-like protien
MRFLQWLRPEGPWVLTAIPPEGGRTETKTFTDPGQARGWLEALSGRQNLYFMVNPARRDLTSKASKDDVEELAFLHVDVDPRKGEDLAKEQARAIKVLEDFSPSPSAIIFSGGGYQAFWRLEEPVFVGGDVNRIAESEAYNRQMEIVLGGDHCWNIDRIMRIPGTINVPDEKKRKRGRTETLATIVEMSDVAYPLHDFTPAPEVQSTKGTGSANKVVISGNLPRLKDLDELPEQVTQRTRMLIVQGDDSDDPTRYGSKSEVMWAVVCELVRAGCEDDMIAAVLLDPDLGVSDHPLRQKRSVEYVARQIERARVEVDKDEVGPNGRRVLDPVAPFSNAKRLRDELFPDAIHTNDDWLAYERGAYRVVEDASMRSAVWEALDTATVRKVKDDVVTFVPFKPGPGQVSGVLDAMEAVAHQPADRMAPPVWLDGDGPPPGEIISCRNGLLHVPTGELLPPTPRFFTRNALDLDFDPGAPEPREWLTFIEQTFPDGDAATLLQEWFGYLLLPDMTQEKMLLMVGPPRSGKGTIQKVLTELVGRSNICAPSIKSLGGDFGLQPMIGKQVAFLSDIRLGSSSDRAAITETLLRITGRDPVTADRKHKDQWTGNLAVRFVISTNELPSLSDNSPALSNRFVPLILEQSHLGREDHGLADRLIAELPGILNWSLAGWRSLRERGAFKLPAISVKAVSEIMELGSPTARFISECCVLGPSLRVEKDRLFAAWRRWCEDKGERASGESHFASNLRSATSQTVKGARPRDGVGRLNVYLGIALADDGEREMVSPSNLFDPY